MKYKFTYQTTGLDIWQLSIYRIYSSMIGITNIVFTVAMLLLGVKFWSSVNLFIRVLIGFAVSLFTVIQPLAIYKRARRQAANAPEEIEIGFNNKGVHVKSGKQSSYLKWQRIKDVSKIPGMIVVRSTDKHGFILANRVLGQEKEDLYEYVLSMINK